VRWFQRNASDCSHPIDALEHRRDAPGRHALHPLHRGRRDAADDREARKYLVKSEMDASFWYDTSGRWVKCSFIAQGSKVDYVLRELPS
jgi:hypothetical protein